MMKKVNPNDEEAVKIMAGILLDRVLSDQGDQFEAPDLEQWVNAHAQAKKCFSELSEPQRLLTKLHNYRRCSLRTRKAFQELMHRVSPPVSPLPNLQTHSDSLT
jgi:hypothetical protein